MSNVANSFIKQRAKLLAMVQFTSRPDLQVSDFPEGGGLDLLVQTVFGIDYHGIFGVALEGTNQPIRHAEAATHLLRGLSQEGLTKPSPKYSLPSVVLLFSMRDDRGYYAWRVEPVIDRASEPRMKWLDTPDCKPFNRSTLAEIVIQINEWQSRLFDRLAIA